MQSKTLFESKLKYIFCIVMIFQILLYQLILLLRLLMFYFNVWCLNLTIKEVYFVFQKVTKTFYESSYRYSKSPWCFYFESFLVLLKLGLQMERELLFFNLLILMYVYSMRDCFYLKQPHTISMLCFHSCSHSFKLPICWWMLGHVTIFLLDKLWLSFSSYSWLETAPELKMQKSNNLKFQELVFNLKHINKYIKIHEEIINEEKRGLKNFDDCFKQYLG